MSAPLPATRVAAWPRCFLQINNAWLIQLTADVRNELHKLRKEDVKGNGEHVCNSCFSNTALKYGMLQAMKPSERYDPEHFDGGASLIHGGLTIFGVRHLECKVAASSAGAGECEVAASAATEAWEVLPQRPGSFYIGNLTAPWHRVRHTEIAAPFCPAVDVHVAVMLRTDVFRHSRSRATKVKPQPVKVFDIVNEVAAAALSSRPLRFPDLADCLAEHSRLA